MKISLITLLLIGLAACAPGEGTPPLDVVLLGGTVYSGANAEPVVSDVGISGDRVIAVGDLAEHPADLRLDVSGLAVVPGFIDIHSHAVRSEPNDGIFRWPDAENLIRQGVTTVLGGPDGGSPLPITDTLTAIEENPASVNFGTFVGHGSIRGLVIGEEDRPPTDEELDRMRAEVQKAMEAGA
ncbi:MAG: D-aminoacylase, partial [Gammaproteobacteria bacterium]|nr:D-aminoacylase [Gammaproteobacteria bacterium]